jgi:signal transduction histidine kinase
MIYLFQELPLIKDLLKPHQSITQPSDYDRVLLLQTLHISLIFISLLTIVGITLTFGITTTVRLLGVAIVFFIVSYGISRTQYYRISLFFLNISIYLFSIAITLANPIASQALVGMFPIFAVSIFMSPVRVLMMTVIIGLSIWGLSPIIISPWADTLRSIGFVVFAGIMTSINTALLSHTQNKLKKRTQALESNQRRLREVIDSSLDALFLMKAVRDASGKAVDMRVIDLNERVTQLIPFSAEQLMSKTILELFPPFMESLYFKKVLECFDTKQSYNAEVQDTIINKGWWLYIQCIPTDEGLVLTIRDISDRKRAETERLAAESLRVSLEKEREMNTIKTNMMIMISHEFRTPLTVIQMARDTLTNYYDRLTPEQRQQRLDSISTKVKELSGLIQDINDTIASSNRQVDFNPTTINLDSSLRFMISQLKETPLFSHQITYSSKGSLEKVWMDAQVVETIVENLLNNAMKFSPENSTIYVSAIQQGDTVEITVSDTGIGIPAEDLSKIFMPFTRGSNTGTIRGTGLGLTIVQELVQLHQGKIELSSVVDKGTTVKVILPIVKITPPNTAI